MLSAKCNASEQLAQTRPPFEIEAEALPSDQRRAAHPHQSPKHRLDAPDVQAFAERDLDLPGGGGQIPGRARHELVDRVGRLTSRQRLGEEGPVGAGRSVNL